MDIFVFLESIALRSEKDTVIYLDPLYIGTTTSLKENKSWDANCFKNLLVKLNETFSQSTYFISELSSFETIKIIKSFKLHYRIIAKNTGTARELDKYEILISNKKMRVAQ